jgi:hypothetical protein
MSANLERLCESFDWNSDEYFGDICDDYDDDERDEWDDYYAAAAYSVGAVCCL